MKFSFNYLLVLAFLIVSSTIGAQSLSDLEKKRGFKTFVLGDDISKYTGKLVYYSTSQSGEVLYKYVPSNADELTVFFNKFTNIYLFFKDGKLQNISLKKSYSGDSYDTALEELKTLVGNLMELFGTPNEKIDRDPLMGYAWNGKEIMLICTNKYMGLTKGSETEIMITDYAKVLKAGF